MKTTKLLSMLLILMLAVLLISGCAQSAPTDEPATEQPAAEAPAVEEEAPAPEPADINIAVLKGPTGMGAAYLMEQNALGEAANNYTFTVAGSPDDVIAQLVTGELDMAALPTNAIAALYKKTTGQVKIAAVNTLGVLYVLENGDSITSVADLAGKTILASGQGSTAEYVLNYVLAQNGLTPDENVTVVYATEHAEAATLAATGEYDVVLLPEPFVTSLQKQAPDFRVALNLAEEWEAASGSVLTMGGVAVRSELLESNPAAVAAFLDEYAASAAWVNENTEEAAQLIEKYEIMAAAVAGSALPRCNIVCYTGDQMKTALVDFYTVLFDMNPAAIGGEMPADDFYYFAE